MRRHDGFDYFGEAARVGLYDLQHVLVRCAVREHLLEESLARAVLSALLVRLLGPAKHLGSICQLILVPKDDGHQFDWILALPIRARDDTVQAELLLDHVEGAQRSCAVGHCLFVN